MEGVLVMKWLVGTVLLLAGYTVLGWTDTLSNREIIAAFLIVAAGFTLGEGYKR